MYEELDCRMGSAMLKLCGGWGDAARRTTKGEPLVLRIGVSPRVGEGVVPEEPPGPPGAVCGRRMT